jgi:thiamine kinase-like enzyme
MAVSPFEAASMPHTLTPILNRIPLFAGQPGLKIAELSGGITNRNYKIETAGGHAFVLRVGGNDTGLLGIDRRTEYGCTLAASRVGVAPEPVAYLEPEGYIITRFISGAGLPAETVGTAANIRRVVESLKLYHSLDGFPGSFSPFRVAEEYEGTARRFNVNLPEKMGWYLEKAHEVERAMYREPFTPRPCHNDLLNGNFIDDGTRIRILDWEYAGMGDLFFDLGNFAVQHEFNEEQDDILLHEYFGQPAPAHRARLKLMKIMSDLREAMWGMVQVGISTLDFDYVGYGQKYFDRFEAAVRDAGYQRWLAEV